MNDDHCTPVIQTHVHEFTGSTMNGAPVGRPDLLHSHRFAGVSGEAIKSGASHVHRLTTRTDFFTSHFHTIEVMTGPAIPIFDENNVQIGHTHGFTGATSVNAAHSHVFKVATLIEDPTGPVSDMD
jgi:hypothetical protein